MFCTESWVQEFSKKGGGHHNSHIHGDNHVSAFYYLKCSENTSRYFSLIDWQQNDEVAQKDSKKVGYGK